MIKNLSIKNYALIDDIRVSFQEGLTIITGETGAGKSILLDALSLLMGKRADLSSVKDNSKKCIIEAGFSIASYDLASFFESMDFDYDEETILRREILPSGKSRAFVNDTPVQLQALQLLGNRLLAIHTQHQTLEAASDAFPYMLVDTLAKNQPVLQRYETTLETLKTTKKELDQALEKQAAAEKELEYHSFLLEELEAVKLQVGEQEGLEEEFETLNNAEAIQESLAEALQLLDQEEIGGLKILQEAKLRIQKVKEFSAPLAVLWERLQSVVIELDDVSEALARQVEIMESNPQRLEEVQDRLQKIYTLQKKHQVDSVSGLLEIQEQLAGQVSETQNLEHHIATLRQTIDKTTTTLHTHAMTLHKNREAVLPGLLKALEALLRELGLPNARVELPLTLTETFYSNGMDQLVFLFSANKGSACKPLKKAASGGELSRIMLAVKSVLAKYSNLPTLIFDEIDTGVSGEIANKIGEILQRMGGTMQVLAITHLPQIAAKGSQHFKVFKEDGAASTSTHLQELEPEARVMELAQMLGGEKKSDSAIAHARQLLN